MYFWLDMIQREFDSRIPSLQLLTVFNMGLPFDIGSRPTYFLRDNFSPVAIWRLGKLLSLADSISQFIALPTLRYEKIRWLKQNQSCKVAVNRLDRHWAEGQKQWPQRGHLVLRDARRTGGRQSSHLPSRQAAARTRHLHRFDEQFDFDEKTPHNCPLEFDTGNNLFAVRPCEARVLPQAALTGAGLKSGDPLFGWREWLRTSVNILVYLAQNC